MPDKDFLQRLDHNLDTAPSRKVWPQLRAILATDVEVDEFLDSNGLVGLWQRSAYWRQQHPLEPWAPETERLFELATEFYTEGNHQVALERMLRLWTEQGTRVPPDSGKKAVCRALENTPSPFGLLRAAPCATAWMPHATQQTWLDEAHKHVRHTPSPSGQSFHVYLHGDMGLLNTAQKKNARRVLAGAYEILPLSYERVHITAAAQAEPLAWIATLLDDAWTRTVPSKVVAMARQSIGRLDPLLDAVAWPRCGNAAVPWSEDHTRCLVLTALMAQEGGYEGLDTGAWTTRVPLLWQRTVDSFPVVEGLHGLRHENRRRDHYVSELCAILFNEHRAWLLDLDGDPPHKVSSQFFSALDCPL